MNGLKLKTPPSLAGLLPEEIARLAEGEASFPSYRLKQICEWTRRGVLSFDDMHNLPLEMRKSLKSRFRLFSSAVSAVLEDEDGTVKFQITLEDGNKIEAVILNDGKGRKTACLSVQAGCPAACVFCKTGALGFTRNLKAGEITEEYIFLKKHAPDISHIVIMGMGEPLFNLEELRKASGFFCGKEGFNISRRRITLSTSGIVPGIRDMADNGPDLKLALSLTSAREDLRARLMPVAKDNPLTLLKESLVYFQKKQKSRITLEAVLLGGINTGPEDARELFRFARGLDAVINLIPWNPVGGLLFEGKALTPPPESEIAEYEAALKSRGLNVTRRYKKGRGVMGACGQLGETSFP